MSKAAVDLTIIASFSAEALIAMTPEQSRAVLMGYADVIDAARALKQMAWREIREGVFMPAPEA